MKHHLVPTFRFRLQKQRSDECWLDAPSVSDDDFALIQEWIDANCPEHSFVRVL